MSSPQPTRLAPVLPFVLFALGACGGSPGGAAVEAFEASLAALEDGEFSAYLERAASKVQLEQMKASWAQQRQVAPSPDEAAQFRQMMAVLTAKDAEEQVFGFVAPQLAMIEEQAAGFADMLPMLVGGLGGQQAAPAVDALVALGDRLPTLGLSDEKKLKQAIRVVTGAARKLGLKELDAVRALDFDDLLDKADVLYGGVNDLLEVYGLSLEETLASTEVKVQSASENQAVLEVSYSLFGGPRQMSTLEMMRVDGRWVPTGR